MYTPSDDILKKYADVLIKCALNGGEGIKPKEKVLVRVPECAKPMYLALRRSVLEAGGYPIMQYMPDEVQREFYEIASDDQIEFFPATYMKGLVDEMDHLVAIIGSTNKHELKGIPSEKIMARNRAYKPWMDWRRDKEDAGKFTWTLAMYGTPAMAAEVEMSEEEYWAEIIKACWLDADDPIAKWREILDEVERVKDRLNALDIDTLHVEAENTDLTVKLGDNRKWMGGSGRNIPSYEIFASPDWRGTEGYIQFTEPLYRYGNLITDVYLEFEAGKVVKATASEGQEVLRSMIAEKNADKIGEYSLTDRRVSQITRFMGETLFDENVGGEEGNTHLALGNAYRDGYDGDPAKVKDEEWEKMGFNESSVHTDVVSTSRRKVTATLKDGSKKVIYKDGEFTV